MATVAFFYQVAALLFTVLVFVLFVRGARGVPYPPEMRTRRGPVSGLSVVLVLDAEADAEHCVAALLAQDYPKLQLVVVLTGALVDKTTRVRLEADPRVRLLELADPPVGWMRKNAAFAEGFAQVQHEYVLFIDGDVLLKPFGVERALRLAKRRGADLLTIFPALTATSRTERLMIPFFLQLALAGVSMHDINDPKSDAAGGFAPFFLFRSVVYKALGGHAAVRADRFSESTLAQSTKDQGYRLLIANGTELAILQGQNSLHDIWRSWGKSFNATIGNDKRQAALVAAVVFAVFALPWLLVVLAVARIATAPETLADSPWVGAVIVGAANIILGIYHRRALRNLLDIDDSLAWMQPLAATIAALMIFASSLHLEGRYGARPR